VTLKDPIFMERLDRDGYAVVKQVFSTNEIAQLRGEARALLDSKSRKMNGGLCHGPVCHESDLAERLLHEPRLAFGGRGELPRQIHVHANTYNYWHADLHPLNQNDLSSAAWMYKVVIYLQDHSERDGLSVIPHSHKQGNTIYQPLHVCTRAGDIAVFHHSIQHAGRLPNAVLGNIASRLYRLRVIDTPGRLYWFQNLFQLTCDIERLAIFLYYVAICDLPKYYDEPRASI